MGQQCFGWNKLSHFECSQIIKTRKKKKCKSKAIKVININVQNSNVIISEKEKSENEKLSSVLLENMIQIQHEMFSHFNHQTNTECNTLSIENEQSEEDEKLQTNYPNAKHLTLPQNKNNHDRNASFSSSMNGHLMHFYEEEALEISNEKSQRQRIDLSENESKEFDKNEEQQNDVLDLNDSDCTDHEFENDQVPIPTISEMSFNAWTLNPKQSESMDTKCLTSHHREQSHYDVVDVDDKREEIIDSFLKNNDFVYKKDLSQTRTRRIKSVEQRKKHKNKKYKSVENKLLKHSKTAPAQYGIDDIFNSFNNLENV